VMGRRASEGWLDPFPPPASANDFEGVVEAEKLLVYTRKERL
jgi:hypothetical protein